MRVRSEYLNPGVDPPTTDWLPPETYCILPASSNKTDKMSIPNPHTKIMPISYISYASNIESGEDNDSISHNNMYDDSKNYN